MEVKPWQWEIAYHIVMNERCNVWSTMGSGKTLATLLAIDMLMVSEDVWPILIVAPKRVAQHVWEQEAAKWPMTQHMKMQRILGPEKSRLKAVQNYDARVFVINFENIPWLANHYKERWPFRMIVVDESSRLKGHRAYNGSKRTLALQRKAWGKTRRFVNLTGTPAPNGLIDLWGQQHFVDGGLRLGNRFSSFRFRWFDGKRVGHHPQAMVWTPKKNADPEIRAILNDVTITVDVRDYMEVGDTVENVIEVELPPKARQAYKQMENEMFTTLEAGTSEAMSAPAATSKCHQISNGAVYLDDGSWQKLHDAKLDALDSIIEECAGEPILVVYHFRHDLERLRARFPIGIDLGDDPNLVEQWNRRNVPLMFVHPQSAGHGLNLAKGGHVMAFFSLDWNLEYHQQVIERIGAVRQTQAETGKVPHIHYIVAKDTIDESILQRLRDKRSVQEVLLEAMKRRTK